MIVSGVANFARNNPITCLLSAKLIIIIGTFNLLLVWLFSTVQWETNFISFVIIYKIERKTSLDSFV